MLRCLKYMYFFSYQSTFICCMCKLVAPLFILPAYYSFSRLHPHLDYHILIANMFTLKIELNITWKYGIRVSVTLVNLSYIVNMAPIFYTLFVVVQHGHPLSYLPHHLFVIWLINVACGQLNCKTPAIEGKTFTIIKCNEF